MTYPAPSTALLERESLLGEIGRLLDAASTGNGTLLLIAGEAGSGKTTLVREAARRHDAKALVIIGGCDPLTTLQVGRPEPGTRHRSGSGSSELGVAASPHSGVH